MTAQRISSAALDRLAGELSERDWTVVQMLERLHLATGNQIRRAH
jgi:hypothetical protein